MNTFNTKISHTFRSSSGLSIGGGHQTKCLQISRRISSYCTTKASMNQLGGAASNYDDHKNEYKCRRKHYKNLFLLLAPGSNMSTRLMEAKLLES
ncbi:hypothetical protein PoB_005412600 [Plakobranchus ocellatus]|uniref:Uncharacterized protein n=1 Tax=Plakobranchus ocellatus TaxID=259542 RepID=A0AAV4C4E0_9GAST|nr:hypothetical protein PoB_005412600 [Plakobranchus ocellatus]